MNSRANVSGNTGMGMSDMNTDSCISVGKVAMAFGIAALLFSMATAYKVAVFGQPAFSFLGAAPDQAVAWQETAPPDLGLEALLGPDNEGGGEVDDKMLGDLLDEAPMPVSAGHRPPALSPRLAVGLSIDRLDDHAAILESSARELSLLIEGR